MLVVANLVKNSSQIFFFKINVRVREKFIFYIMLTNYLYITNYLYNVFIIPYISL